MPVVLTPIPPSSTATATPSGTGTTNIKVETRTPAGVLIDVDHVYLRDPTNTFGLRRIDTFAAVIAAGTELTRVSLGTYQLVPPLTDPAPGLTYEYWPEVDYGGTVVRWEETSQSDLRRTTDSVAGRYATWADIQDIFGILNVATWSQLDNNLTEADTVRIAKALANADAKIDGTLARLYVTPMTLTGTDAVIVREWAAKLAGIWLYQSRGQQDTDKKGNDYEAMSEEVMTDIRLYRGGQIRQLNATLRSGLTLGMGVVDTELAVATAWRNRYWSYPYAGIGY